MLTSLFSLFYVTGEFHRFLHRGRAKILIKFILKPKKELASKMVKNKSSLSIHRLIF